MKRYAALFLILALVIAAGCKGSSQEQPGTTTQSDFKKIMNRTSSPQELIKYANHSISGLSRADATQLVLRLESTQQEQLDSRTDAWLDAEIQTALQQFDFSSTLDDMIKGVSDQKLKNMLTEIRASGFKLISLEGAYYPIIDYEKYQVYQPYINDDIKSYIDIAASESEQQYINDAALVITWPELAKRTIRAEDFVKKYPTSVKTEDVRQQYGLYVSNYLYGANNTPAFDYQTKTLNEAARQSYYEVAKNDKGRVAEVIKQYLPILEKNKYKRTPEVEQYLKNSEQSLKSTK